MAENIERQIATDPVRAGVVHAQAEAWRENSYPSDPGFGNVDDVDMNALARDDIGWWRSAGAEFKASGIITGTLGSEMDADGPRRLLPVDPDYDLTAHYNSDPEFKTRIDKFLTEQNDYLLDQLADSQSAEETEWLIKQAEDEIERQAVAEANGWTAQAAGMLGGFGLDIVATILSGGLAAPLTTARYTAPLLTALRGSTAATRVGAAAGGAARLGALGATEGVLERAAQRLSNPLVEDEDIAFAGIMGLAFGGTLGAVFPKLAGMDIRRILTDGELATEKAATEAFDLAIEAKAAMANRADDVAENSIDLVAGGAQRDLGDGMTASVKTLEDEAQKAGLTGDQLAEARKCWL